MSQQSYNEAEASTFIIVVFSLITAIADLIIFFLLHQVSLKIPRPNQYDHMNQKRGCVLGRKYPSFYFVDSSKVINNDNDPNADDEKEEIQALIRHNDQVYFGENDVSFWSKLFRHRTTMEYVILSLQIWSFCCGVIAFYLSSVFSMNMILEYLLNCISNGWSAHLVGLFGLFFLIENIFWTIRRQFESIHIMCRNAMDIYDIRIITIWRSFQLFLCTLFAIWVAFDDDFIPFSDILFWQFFLFFMVIHGIIFQILYGVISFIQSVTILTSMICCRIANNYKRLTPWQLFFIIEPNQRQNDGVQCPKWVQYGFIFATYFYIAVFILLFIINGDELFRFAASTAILYYTILIFERGKYNALYIVWTTRYHKEYFERLKGMEELNVANNNNTTQSIVSMDIADESQVMNNKKVKKRSHHHQQNTNGTMLIKPDADLPLIEAAHVDILRADELMIHHINYRQFWNNIKYDYARNDNFGCNKYCHCAQDWLGWICVVIFIIATILSGYLYIAQSNETTKEMFEDDNGFLLSTTYPICDFSLRENNDYLSVMDLVYLSIVAYHGSNSDINKQFNNWFGNNYTTSWDMDSLYIHQNPSFFHVYNKKYNFDIIAVRGTMDKSDVEQDIGLWSEVATFQIFSWLIPLTNVLPIGFIRQFVNLASIPEKMIAPSIRDNYDGPVYDYIKNEVIPIRNDSYVIITGHSLGGGLSQIVAARLYNDGYSNNDNIMSFSISSPGTLYTSKKFGFSVDSLDKTSVSLLPRRDIVSTVDVHGGIIQMIECDAKQIFSCHSAQTSFCEMYQQCSDQLTRNISFANCVCVEKDDWSKCW